ncbi:TetR/AcrR family transcriptional regulator [Streptomyces collinus]
MPRSPDPAKRRALLDRVRAYVLHNGLTDLSLRPLAQALGTSDRMLLYYFGTKERLVAEVVAFDERRPLLRIHTLLKTAGSPTDAAGLRRFLEELWRQFSEPDARAVRPLYLEIMSVSVLHPDRYGPVMRDMVTQWTALFTSILRDLGLDQTSASAQATLLTDTSLGLLMAPLADGHWKRADTAFRNLLDALEPGWHPTHGRTS